MSNPARTPSCWRVSPQTFLVSAALLGAVVFGMVIASGLGFTPTTNAWNQAAEDGAGQAVAQHATSSIGSFADLADAVVPAVVFVQSTTIGTTDLRGGGNPFERFFDFDPRAPRGRQGEPEDREFRSDGAGTGFLVSSDGYIVTNNHVIDDATTVQVSLGETEYEAEVKGTDPLTDLALLKIEGGPFEYLALGDSESLRVGEWVMAVGNPLGLRETVTVGVVSAKGRGSLPELSDVSFQNFIQTDAAINRGNSGGPLLNTRGQVVGIATAMNFGAENIGFAVPVDTLKRVLPQLREDGKVSRGYLGVGIENLDEDTAEAFGLDSAKGALVINVNADTPAAKAGIEHGDIIVRVDQHEVDETRDLINYVSSKPPGAKVEVEVIRDGERVERTITLGDRDDLPGRGAATRDEPEEDDEGEIDWLGLQYGSLNDQWRERLGLEDGDVEGVVVMDIAATSPLYEEAVRPGDVIQEVNGTAVESIAEFEAAVRSIEEGRFVRLYILRRGQEAGGYFAITRRP